MFKASDDSFTDELNSMVKGKEGKFIMLNRFLHSQCPTQTHPLPPPPPSHILLTIP